MTDKRCPNCQRPMPTVKVNSADTDAWYCANCDDVIFIKKREFVESLSKDGEE